MDRDGTRLRERGFENLLRYRRRFDSMVRVARSLESRVDDEVLARLIEEAATYATHFHCGRLWDPDLEAMAVAIGRRLAQPPNDESSRTGAGRGGEVHVLSRVGESGGGHARLVRDWLRNARGGVDKVVVTRQDGEVPDWFLSALRELEIRVEVLAATSSLLERARALRRALNDARWVVLHVHPDDVTPLLALAPESGPVVAHMNHADHIFWLGASIADARIDFRDYPGSGKRFEPRLAATIPLPLAPSSEEPGERALGGPRLVAMAAGYKFRPSCRQSFFAWTAPVLRRFPEASLDIVCDSPSRLSRHVPEDVRDRVRFLGTVPDGDVVLRRADLVLESFPYGSWNTVLDAAAVGTAVVLKPAPEESYLVIGDEALAGLLAHAPGPQEYLREIEELVASAPARRQRAAALRASVRRAHSGEAWRSRVEALRERLSGLAHAPHGRLPEPEPAAREEDAVKAYFSELHWGDDGAMRSHFAKRRLADAVQALRHRRAADFVRLWVSAVRLSLGTSLAHLLGLLRPRGIARRHRP